MESNEPEQSRKLFIGGLNYNATVDLLRKFFEQWGKIVDVVVIHDPITKKGFGFVTYSQSSMVDRAMSVRPHYINGRKVDTKRAISRDDIGKPNIRATVKKMFVFGIKEQSENDLLEYFGKFGNILNIKIVIAKDSGKRKGYGFIEYDDTDSVDKAIFIKSHHVAGGKLDVSKSISRTDIAGYSRGEHDNVGVNRCSWRVNPLYEQWGAYYNRSNGWVGAYENSGVRGRYGSVGGSSAHFFQNHSNSGRAWQGVNQRLGYNNPPRGYQRSGGWGNSQQPSINLAPNQSYDLTNSYYTINNHATPYGYSGVGYVKCKCLYGGNGQYHG